MFNLANVDNRLRYPVRGRVIVSTTSKVVEFLESNLKYSYPLYSVDSYPPGFMLSFLVEVDGFLTFDPNSEVKITPELKPFEALYYDPKAFNLVRTADPFGRVILEANVVWASANYAEYQASGYKTGTYTRLAITYQTDAAGNQERQYFSIAPIAADPDNGDPAVNAFMQSLDLAGSPYGKPYKGPKGYPGCTPLANND